MVVQDLSKIGNIWIQRISGPSGCSSNRDIINLRERTVTTPCRYARQNNWKPLFDDAEVTIIKKKQEQAEVGSFRERASIEPKTAVTRKTNDIASRINKLRADREPKGPPIAEPR